MARKRRTVWLRPQRTARDIIRPRMYSPRWHMSMVECVTFISFDNLKLLRRWHFPLPVFSFPSYGTKLPCPFFLAICCYSLFHSPVQLSCVWEGGWRKNVTHIPALSMAFVLRPAPTSLCPVTSTCSGDDVRPALSSHVCMQPTHLLLTPSFMVQYIIMCS